MKYQIANTHSLAIITSGLVIVTERPILLRLPHNDNIDCALTRLPRDEALIRKILVILA